MIQHHRGNAGKSLTRQTRKPGGHNLTKCLNRKADITDLKCCLRLFPQEHTEQDTKGKILADCSCKSGSFNSHMQHPDEIGIQKNI